MSFMLINALFQTLIWSVFLIITLHGFRKLNKKQDW